ncbi:MAG: hypothetical protein KAJ55_03355 [Anaerolineales bacterium]|nr:hypothetical protein [Anaerolineales bacterium]
MSTRCNVSLQYREKQGGKPAIEITLYRHCDGYPETVGGDIVEFIQAQQVAHAGRMATDQWPGRMAVHFDATLRCFLTETYDFELHSGKQHPYEVTTGVHGDIEHYYAIKLAATEPHLTIQHAARPPWDSGSRLEVDEWIEANKTSYSVDRFIVIVNKERQATNQRIIQLQRDNPDNKHYQDADRYTMLSPLTMHTRELLEQTYEQYRVARDKRRAELAEKPSKEVSVPELVEGLEAVGLNPIVIDEKTDFSKLPPLK